MVTHVRNGSPLSHLPILLLGIGLYCIHIVSPHPAFWLMAKFSKGLIYQ